MTTNIRINSDRLWDSLMELAKIGATDKGGVRRLALFHHAPERSDTEVDGMLAEARALVGQAGARLDVVAAFEGMDLQLGRP